MKSRILLAALLTCPFWSLSQSTWSGNIAEIMYENCTNCHRDGGIAPFSLLTFDDASGDNGDLAEAVLTGYMPPWHADPEYQSFAHERILETDDMLAIVEWFNNGMPEGNPDDTPPPPIYPEDGFISAPADLELQMDTYTSQATSWADDYICVSIPMGLSEDKVLRAFEVVPGNAQIVHHCLLHVLPGGLYPSDFSGSCGGPTEGLIGGYTPGAIPTVFPSNGDDINMGVTIPAGSDLILAMHYPEGSAGEQDATKVRLYFYDDPQDIREISTNSLIQNWFFSLPANEVTDVTAEFNLVPTEYSLLSVFPHMHLLGKNIKSYGVTQEGDTIPFIDIPHWDFEWQQFYAFETLNVIPAWTSIKGEGTYDNTTNNPHNPNNPPQDVNPGLNTSDEMFLVYFQFLPYEDGDENISLEELTSLPTLIEELQINETGIEISTYPNPFVDQISFELAVDQASQVSLYIYDNDGALVDVVAEKQLLQPGINRWTWAPQNDLAAGMYHYSLRLDGALTSGLIMRK